MSTISVEARHLAVVEDGYQVIWQYQGDLGSVLHHAVKTGIDVPSTAEGGFILVALDIDGEGFDIVQTETCRESKDKTSLAIIAKAITALQVAERGIRAAEGPARRSQDEPTRRPEPDVPGYCTCGTLTKLCEGQR